MEIPIPLLGYQHNLPKPQHVHMKLVAIHIVEGIMHPELGRGVHTILYLVPKKEIPPELVKTMGKEGWGLRPRYYFVKWKIVLCITMVECLGLLFVMVWLIKVNPTDLQNATVPVTFFTALVAIGLGFLQQHIA